ncbi:MULTISPECIES: class I SAM-dependent methyltransferase [Paenarthrobacter]|jgi:SAM-dependent methyltransferase|uniref:class I SAM-dependent methyltransferase n=1 Tax=Paenarthrobacter TaxID=1742992 RepID=UPI0003826643|nr:MULTISPECIES: class I SAM-dependent methyltransferase [Paenarthrobacter]KQQ98272.1 hypothetical protein ASF74_14055 [Arthrobacter sp. Leaf145]BCW08987.1 hypothetical protein NtRootA2_02690 [Arthrobacter sp. NtRootA2]BCW13067.1 hypothetical protein NtRootA4_00460 [Arthrobacter sp. NtRootA4]BCW21403.1 hypothetical protein NtRootC7_02700 [Arthrobacter sp. NtRootC7]BCW25670.1 hypothetical protein NtRootC45_02700 [Arthrobacter sp. NtRootC45]BCW29939.1 hypothetical protein NtRootD5_02700 [Arthro
MSGKPATLYTGRGAELYHAIVQSDSSELREIIRCLRGKDARVLELAAGSGRITLAVLPFVRSVTAVDNSAELLSILQEELAKPERVKNAAKVDAVLADILRLELTDQFDAVILGTTSLCLFDADQRRSLLGDIQRWLLPGGELLISLRTPELGGSDFYVHEVSPQLAIEESFDVTAGTFTSKLVERNDAGERVAEYSVTTHLLTEAEFRAELGAAGFAVAAAFDVGPRNRADAIGNYKLFRAHASAAGAGIKEGHTHG